MPVKAVHPTLLILATMLLVLFSLSCSSLAGTENAGIPRIAPEAAKAKLDSGEALMVCSYDDARCEDMLIEGALLKSELQQKQDTLDKDAEIIFYCA